MEGSAPSPLPPRTASGVELGTWEEERKDNRNVQEVADTLNPGAGAFMYTFIYINR